MAINTHIPDSFVSDLDRFMYLSNLESSIFGQIITSVAESETIVSYVPILIEGRSFTFHLSADNPHCEVITAHQLSFTSMGSHGYVSPTWYANNSVPTWNYVICILNGSVTEIESKEKSIASLVNLTVENEGAYGDNWMLNSIGDERTDKLLSRIRFFEVSIDSVLCKSKMSQNKSVADIASIVENLESRGNTELADCIRKENAK